jgi:hypothetical protein
MAKGLQSQILGPTVPNFPLRDGTAKLLAPTRFGYQQPNVSGNLEMTYSYSVRFTVHK